jgi:hypothetical protein
MSSTYTYEQIKGVIRQFTGQANVITTPRPFIKLTGDLAAGAMLGQIYYWSDKMGGWFYKSDQEWADELCMSSYQVRRITKQLADLGVEHSIRKVKGTPKSHYRLNFDVFIPLFIRFLETGSVEKPDFEETHKSDIEVSSKSEIEVSRKSSIDTPITTPINTTTMRNAPSAASAAGGGDGQDEGTKPAPATRKTPKVKDTAAAAYLRGTVRLVDDGVIAELGALDLGFIKRAWAATSAETGATIEQLRGRLVRRLRNELRAPTPASTGQPTVEDLRAMTPDERRKARHQMRLAASMGGSSYGQAAPR